MKTGSEKWKQLIEQGAQGLGITINRNMTELFARHAAALLTWNRKTNLTAITDPFEVAVKHYIDSIAAVGCTAPGMSMLDMGSGGGFPGIPIKIMSPSMSVTLIDASRKKISFLNHAIRLLGLDSIDARHIRAEDLAKEHLTYDIIISRAFSSLENVVSLAFPLLKQNGKIIAMKGKHEKEKLDTLVNRTFSLPDDRNLSMKKIEIEIKEYLLPLIESHRTLYIFNFDPNIFP